MRIKWSVEKLSDEWDELARPYGLPFLDSTNVRLLLKHFGDGTERVMVARRNGKALAMTVLKGRFLTSTFCPSNQPIGLWVQSMEGFEQVLQSLTRRYAMVSVMHLDPDMVERPPDSDVIETVDYIETARITVDTSFDEYWASRRSLKANLKNRQNRLAKAGIVPRLEVVTDPAKIGAAVDDYGRLESQGWKGAQGTATHPDNAQGRYYREWFTELARTGHGSVWRYFYGDKLVASDLCVHRDGTFVVAKTTYDEEERNTSPSHLMRREMFQRLFAEGKTSAIEFYGRAKGWHREFTDEIRTMYHVNAFPAPFVRRARAVVRDWLGRRGSVPVPSEATPGAD